MLYLSFFLQPCKMGIFQVIFIGVHLLYNVVLVFTIQQSESAIHIHIASLFLDFLSIQVTTEQNRVPGALQYVFTGYLYYTQYQYVYVSIPIFQFISPPPLAFILNTHSLLELILQIIGIYINCGVMCFLQAVNLLITGLAY